MTSRLHTNHSSTQPDPKVLAVLGALQTVSLAVITTIAGAVVITWLFPTFATHIPAAKHHMRIDTAVLVLLSGLCIVLDQHRRSAASHRIARIIGLIVSFAATFILGEHVLGISFHFSALISDDPHPALAHLMSAQVAACFLLLGIVLTSLRVTRRPLAQIVDAIALLLSLLVMIYASALTYRSLSLFGTPMQARISPQAIVCLLLLTFLAFNRRTEYGSFCIMVDSGIGGKTARLAAPFALLLPFCFAMLRGIVTRLHWLPEQNGVVLSSALMALIAFCFVVALAWRCNRLERATVELSLRDQLTQLYNRRGFYLLADQSLRLANRAHSLFFLIFIDLDNLKRINDDLGHITGSERIRDMAMLLQNTFRETDVIGRIGGDEFVVAGNGTPEHARSAIARLQQHIASIAIGPDADHALSFSLGYAVSNESATESLDDLVQRADAMMYEAKRAKKAARKDSGAATHELSDGSVVSVS